MKRLPLDLLPDFPKADYWDLIYGFEATLNLAQARLQERNAQLEEALAQIARLEAQLAKPERLHPSQPRSETADKPAQTDENRPLGGAASRPSPSLAPSGYGLAPARGSVSGVRR